MVMALALAVGLGRPLTISHETYHRPETISLSLAPSINHEAPKLGRLVLACDTGPMIFQACVRSTADGASLMKDHGPVTGLTLTQQSVLGCSSRGL